LRCHLISKSKAESNGEEYAMSYGEDNEELEESRSIQSKLTTQEIGSPHSGGLHD